MAVSLKTVMDLSKRYISDVVKQIHIDKVYLYGSYAKGTQGYDSDVDICFFSSEFEGKPHWEVLTDLFMLKRVYDSRILIEPNAFPTSELTNDNPFVKEILRTGKEIVLEKT
jgi:predicted nucleotidyltransferase